MEGRSVDALPADRRQKKNVVLGTKERIYSTTRATSNVKIKKEMIY
jgi:hypothetical protein